MQNTILLLNSNKIFAYFGIAYLTSSLPQRNWEPSWKEYLSQAADKHTLHCQKTQFSSKARHTSTRTPRLGASWVAWGVTGNILQGWETVERFYRARKTTCIHVLLLIPANYPACWFMNCTCNSTPTLCLPLHYKQNWRLLSATRSTARYRTCPICHFSHTAHLLNACLEKQRSGCTEL